MPSPQFFPSFSNVASWSSYHVVQTLALLGTGSLFWGPGKLEAVDIKAWRSSVTESGLPSPSTQRLDVRTGGKDEMQCSGELQVFSRSDLHAVVSIQLQKCTELLKPELHRVNQMKPELSGRWQVFQ